MLEPAPRNKRVFAFALVFHILIVQHLSKTNKRDDDDDDDDDNDGLKR